MNDVIVDMAEGPFENVMFMPMHDHRRHCFTINQSAARREVTLEPGDQVVLYTEEDGRTVIGLVVVHRWTDANGVTHIEDNDYLLIDSGKHVDEFQIGPGSGTQDGWSEP
jgi:hypothetical protein